MFSRILGPPVLIAAAVGVPYVATHGPNIDGLFPNQETQQAASPDPHVELLKQLPSQQTRPIAPPGPGAELYPTQVPLEGLPTFSLQEVFNMNVTKQWVYQRWARKSTALSELGLFGVRVPLVTGTQMHDLAGSLTYFFGNDGQVRRISFHGTTADTSQLVMLVAQHYRLQPQSTPVAGEQLFQIRRDNQVFSELRTRPAPVLWSSSPHDSFSVDLELQRPDVTTPLPSRVAIAPTQPPQQPAVPVATQQKPPEQAQEKPAAAKPTKSEKPQEKWNVFFPRSRVPKGQVNNLERRDQIW